MELTQDNITVLSENVRKIISRKDKLHKFLKVFPFESLLSLKFMESGINGHCMKLLQQLAIQAESYQNLQFVSCTLEFVVMIVAKLRIDKYTLTSSLDLLKTVLSQLSNLPTLQEQLVDPERICEVLIIASRSQVTDMKCASLSASILINVLEMQANIPAEVQNAVKIIFEACCKQDAVSGMCDLANCVLENCNTLVDYFIPIYIWISQESCKYINIIRNYEVSYKLVRCLNNFLRKYDVVKHTSHVKYYILLHSHLKTKFSTICQMCFHPKLYRDSVQILGHMVIDFLLKTNIPVREIQQLIVHESHKLARHIIQWPFMDSKLFFIICHILYLNDTLLWSNDEIMNAIEKQLGGLSMSKLSFAVMKSIFFLCSVLIADFPAKLRTYDNFLLKFASFSAYPEIYTFHAAQLTWVLNRGTITFKTTVLKEWVKNVQEDEKITSVVKFCKAGELLLRILKQKHEECTLQRTACLIRKLNDEDLRLKVASLLPLVISRPSLLGYIFVAHPTVPQDSNKALILCSLMGTIILKVSDVDVLKGVCLYSKKLLNSLRDIPCSLNEFCKDSRNMSLIVDLSKRVNEPTALEIIRLLQLLLVIQENNHLSPPISTHADLRHLLEGSKKKKLKALQLFRQILSLKKPFLNFDQKSLLSFFYALLNLTDDKGSASQTYMCLILLIQKEPKLALTPISYMHVELNCTAPVDSRSIKMFLKYLINWLKALYILEAHDLRIISLSTVKKLMIECASMERLQVQSYIELLNTMV